jgi:hypothetical protein
LGHDVLLPQLSEGLLRSPWWEDGRGDSARSLLTSSVHSVCEVLGIQKTDGLKESDSRLGSAGVRLGKMDDHAQTGGWASLRSKVRLVAIFGERRLGTLSGSVRPSARFHP